MNLDCRKELLFADSLDEFDHVQKTGSAKLGGQKRSCEHPDYVDFGLETSQHDDSRVSGTCQQDVP
jgi:hypothetical protein